MDSVKSVKCVEPLSLLLQDAHKRPHLNLKEKQHNLQPILHKVSKYQLRRVETMQHNTLVDTINRGACSTTPHSGRQQQQPRGLQHGKNVSLVNISVTTVHGVHLAASWSPWIGFQKRVPHGSPTALDHVSTQGFKCCKWCREYFSGANCNKRRWVNKMQHKHN